MLAFEALMINCKSLEAQRNDLARGCYWKIEDKEDALLWIKIERHVYFITDASSNEDMGYCRSDRHEWHELLKKNMFVYKLTYLERLHDEFANLLFAKELARRFSGTARTANALHPDVIFDTNLKRSMNVPRVIFDPVVGLSNLIVLKTIPQGAATQCYVATNPALAAVTGKYFADCNIANPRADAEDSSLFGTFPRKSQWLYDKWG